MCSAKHSNVGKANCRRTIYGLLFNQSKILFLSDHQRRPDAIQAIVTDTAAQY